MPETKAWAGQAHDAAVEMFDRAHKQTMSFSDYTAAIGKAPVTVPAGSTTRE